MTIPRSERSSLFTEAEAQQLQLGADSERGLRPSSEPRPSPVFEKPGLKLETSRQGESIQTVLMQQEELSDLLVEALQGHRAVLGALASMHALLTREFMAARIALDSVTNMLQEEEEEEE